MRLIMNQYFPSKENPVKVIYRDDERATTIYKYITDKEDWEALFEKMKFESGKMCIIDLKTGERIGNLNLGWE